MPALRYFTVRTVLSPWFCGVVYGLLFFLYSCQVFSSLFSSEPGFVVFKFVICYVIIFCNFASGPRSETNKKEMSEWMIRHIMNTGEEKQIGHLL